MLLRRLRCRMPCRWQSSSAKDDFLTAEDLQGGQLVVKKPVVTKEDRLQQRETPPSLNYKHYQRLKGIDFTERDNLIISKREEKYQDWDGELEAMRQATEQNFAITDIDLARIKTHALPFQAPDVNVDKMDITTKQGLADELDVDKPAQDYFTPQMFPQELDASQWLPKRKKGKCIFCLPDPSSRHVKEIAFTNVQLLHKFINKRGMILSRRLTYNCTKHQKRLAKAIRRARVIGFLCPSDNFYPPVSFLKSAAGQTK